MAVPEVYVLGGYQTDFARNWTKESKHFSALMREGVLGALRECQIAPEEVESAHVGNFAAELYCMQGHLGAFFTEVDPAFSGLPTGRHEAACASLATLAVGSASIQQEIAQAGSIPLLIEQYACLPWSLLLCARMADESSNASSCVSCGRRSCGAPSVTSCSGARYDG